MNDELVGHFGVLSPSTAQVARMREYVSSGWEARPVGLWREWIDQFRAAPVRLSCLVIASIGVAVAGYAMIVVVVASKLVGA
jgi:hypothetical protein